MSSCEPSSPISIRGQSTSDLENTDKNQAHLSTNGQHEDSDPWAFLEDELAEFRRIVAELEQIKLQDRQPGM